MSVHHTSMRVGAGLLIGCCLLAVPVMAAGKKKKPAMPPKPVAIAPGSPEIFSLSQRGLQRGVPVQIALTGTNLIGLIELKISNPKITGKLLTPPAPTKTKVWAELKAASDLSRGPYQ